MATIKTINTNGNISFLPSGKIVGFYILDSGNPKSTIRFGMLKRPSLENRKLVELLLGRKWVDKR